MHTVKPELEVTSQHSHFKSDDESESQNNGFKQHQQVSVLTRSDDNQQQQVRIVLGQPQAWNHNIDIVPNGAGLPQVYLNEEPLQVHEKHTIPIYSDDADAQPLVRVHALPGNEVEVDIRDGKVVIVSDGYRAKISTQQTLHGNTVGMCGTNNKDGDDDFTTPQQCVMRKPELFASSWAVSGQNCSGPAKAFATASQQKQQQNCVRVQHLYGNVISDAEAGRKRYRNYNHNVQSSSSSSSESDSSSSSSSSSSDSSNESNSKSNGSSSSSSSSSSSESAEYNPANQKNTLKQCAVKHQAQYIVKGDQICFTKRPLPACSARCKAADKIEKNVDVHCRDASDPVAQQFQKQIQKGGNPDMRTKSVSKTMKFSLPKRCVYAN